MDIKISQFVRGYQGPSQNYYTAQNRFDSILKYKMGIENVNDVISESKNTSIFDENMQINEISYENKTIDTPIFSNTDSITREQFASVKPLSKTVSSIAINGVVDTDDVRKTTSYSASDLNEKLAGSPLAGLGEDFKRAEDLYGVNAVVLMAIAKLESNYGRSKIAQDKNNLFGFQAYDNSPYSSAKSYETKADSIYDVAKHLSNNYLKEGASYFKGYSLDDIGISYSTSSNWAREVKKISSEIVR
jgi:mannosyl-glycoprotein endo-beta-N-acetylglucosaminidase